MCYLIAINNFTAYVALGKTILLEPNLDSLLMPCFSHCLQKYSVYHSLRIYDVCFYILYRSFKGGSQQLSQVTVNINHPSHSIIVNVMFYIAGYFNVCTYMDVFISVSISATKSGAISFRRLLTYKNRDS